MKNCEHNYIKIGSCEWERPKGHVEVTQDVLKCDKCLEVIEGEAKKVK